jgi:uncharacterized protein involved in exopolysaccharide biosynthesis
VLPDEMEAEKNRKIIVSQSNTIEILQQNVRELQEQLNAAHKRITQLTPEETEFIVRNHKGFEG